MRLVFPTLPTTGPAEGNTTVAQIPQLRDRTIPSLDSIIDKIAEINVAIPISVVLVLHWCLFWITNGADKWFNGEFFYGVRFTSALENELLPGIGVSSSLAEGMAIVVGLAEFGIGVLFAVAFVLFITKHRQRFNIALLSINLSLINFLVLSFGAVIFGARAALSNNGIFIAALLLSWIIIHHLRSREQDA